MVEITHQISQFHHQTSKKDRAVSSNSRRKTIMDLHHSKAEIQEIGAHQVKHAMMTAPAAMAAIKGETTAEAAVVVAAAVVDMEAAHVR